MVDATLRHLVRHRAGGRCEYCCLPQDAFDLTFHVEHIVARQHGGLDAPENLALACDRCNLNKGTNLTSIDEATGAAAALFHPRRDLWTEHFEFMGTEITGRTPTGRATVRLLQMNSARRRELRQRLLGEEKP